MAVEAVEAESPETARLTRLCSVLSGTVPIYIYLYFLHSRNKADLQARFP